MDSMVSDGKEFQELSEEAREMVRETRAIMHFVITGKVLCVCMYCGRVFERESSARRHVRTSARCIIARTPMRVSQGAPSATTLSP